MDNTMEQPEFEYDWIALKKAFKTKPRHLEFFAIDLHESTQTDIDQLANPKRSAKDFLYTAGFFCRNEENWFIYRVILPVTRKIHPKQHEELFRKLESGAYNAIVSHNRTKDPLKYLKEISL